MTARLMFPPLISLSSRRFSSGEGADTDSVFLGEGSVRGGRPTHPPPPHLVSRQSDKPECGFTYHVLDIHRCARIALISAPLYSRRIFPGSPGRLASGAQREPSVLIHRTLAIHT